MKIKNRRVGLRYSLLALAVIAAGSEAATFKYGAIEGTLDSQLSLGASWAMENPDNKLIGSNNGGRGAASSAGDDGRLNYRRGDVFSKTIKGLHDLDVRWDNGGFFARGKYWYDYALAEDSTEFIDISNSGRRTAAKSQGAMLLDAFVYQRYSIGDMPGTLRLGRQVVSWGESTFIGGGINSINPIDISSFRRPGAEIKEGLLPVNMVHFSQALTNDLSVEGFYQLKWEESTLDNCGTFFSRSDFAPTGCNVAHIGPNVPALIGDELTETLTGQLALMGYEASFESQGIAVPRERDNKAGDDGQWGLAARYFAQSLNTEFGAYAMNYHSRTPILSARVSTLYGHPLLASLGPLGGAVLVGTSTYKMEYPENIRLYGLSFATNLPTGTALSGEISYRPNMPVQLNAVDMLALINDDVSSPAVASGNNPVTPGMLVRGYNRKEVTQVQLTAIHLFNQVLGASSLSLVGEIGYTHVGGLESKNELRYGRDNVFGAGTNASGIACQGQAVQPQCNNDGYVTKGSWGYRLLSSLDYPDVFQGINLRPSIAFSHDVTGYSPQAGGFNEGAKSVSLGLNADYINKYNASLYYTNFFGGDFNVGRDRDFMAFSVGVNF